LYLNHIQYSTVCKIIFCRR